MCYLMDIGKDKFTKKEWINFGLFESVKEKDIAAMTKLFNRGLKLSYKEQKKENNTIEVILFPAIMRIYRLSGNLKIDVESLYYELKDFWKKNKSKIIELNIIGADGEAEVLINFTNDYIIKLKKQ